MGVAITLADIAKRGLLGGGSGSSGGIEVVSGTLTLAESVRSHLPLFENDKVPDLLYITYTPESNETSVSANRAWAGMGRIEEDGSASNVTFARINGTTFVPTVSYNKTSYYPITNGFVRYPWYSSTTEFAAGQTFYYTAIYFNKGAE